MKKSILILAIILLGGISYGQDTTTVTLEPQFLKSFETTVIDEDTTIYVDSVDLVGFLVFPEKLSAIFYIETFMDSVEIGKVRKKANNVDTQLNVSIKIDGTAYIRSIAYWLSNIDKYTEKNAIKIRRRVGVKIYNKYVYKKRY